MCCLVLCLFILFFFFKQKTAYEMRISDWSSDVCSSDLTIFEQLASEQYIEIDSVQRIEAGLKTKRLFGQAQKRHSCRCGLAIFVEEPGDESLKGIESPNHVVPDCRDRNGVRVSLAQVPYRSEERRVGKECVRTCRSRWSP